MQSADISFILIFLFLLVLSYLEQQELRKRKVGSAFTAAVVSAKLRRKVHDRSRQDVVPEVATAYSADGDDGQYESTKTKLVEGRGKDGSDREQLRVELAEERRKRLELQSKLNNVLSRVEALESKGGAANSLFFR